MQDRINWLITFLRESKETQRRYDILQDALTKANVDGGYIVIDENSIIDAMFFAKVEPAVIVRYINIEIEKIKPIFESNNAKIEKMFEILNS